MKVTQSCPTLGNCIVHRIFQARIQEWVAFPFSRGSSQLGDWSQALQADSLQAEPQGKPADLKEPQKEFSEANTVSKGSQEAICLNFGRVAGNNNGLWGSISCLSIIHSSGVSSRSSNLPLTNRMERK